MMIQTKTENHIDIESKIYQMYSFKIAFFLLFLQLLSGCGVAVVEYQLWGQWGPLIPVGVASTVLFCGVLKWATLYPRQFMENKNLFNFSHSIFVFLTVLVARLVSFQSFDLKEIGVSLFMGLGLGTGSLIITACCIDAVASIRKLNSLPEKTRASFRDWPTTD